MKSLKKIEQILFEISKKYFKNNYLDNKAFHNLVYNIDFNKIIQERSPKFIGNQKSDYIQPNISPAKKIQHFSNFWCFSYPLKNFLNYFSKNYLFFLAFLSTAVKILLFICTCGYRVQTEGSYQRVIVQQKVHLQIKEYFDFLQSIFK